MTSKKEMPEIQRHATISTAQLPAAIQKLRRRLEDVKATTPNTQDEISACAYTIADKVNATFRDVYGAGTVEANEATLKASNFFSMAGLTSFHERLNHFNKVRNRVLARIQAAIEILEEKLDEPDTDPAQRVLRAYDGLDLHPEIARAATDLYRDGHFANAVEAAVKALNGLVRLRSDLELDGTTLMEKAFAPKGPVLKFNDLSDQSDHDEQKGFMMMFSGAVSGLRNPRAHGFVQDDPERALEFIAFVSLLAKLLDGATKA